MRVGIVCSAVLVLLLAHAAFAQIVIDEALSIDNTSGGVSLATATISPAGRQAVYCSAVLETGQVRMLDNGDEPSTTVGRLVEIGDTIEIFRFTHIRAARFIRTGSTSGAAHFTCYPEYPPWVY